jgi:hypothetical protein
MTEKIKEIVDQYLKDDDPLVFWKYRLDQNYYVKFQALLEKHYIRVYLGVELPGYESITSTVYEMQNGPLNDDNKGLAALVEMQYMNAEKINKSNVSINYDCYKSVLKDNDKLRDEIKHLEKESQAWKDKYFQEKMKHTTTEARIVYAKHILDGNRDKDVVENTRF